MPPWLQQILGAIKGNPGAQAPLPPNTPVYQGTVPNAPDALEEMLRKSLAQKNLLKQYLNQVATGKISMNQAEEQALGTNWAEATKAAKKIMSGGQ